MRKSLFGETQKTQFHMGIPLLKDDRLSLAGSSQGNNQSKYSEYIYKYIYYIYINLNRNKFIFES